MFKPIIKHPKLATTLFIYLLGFLNLTLTYYLFGIDIIFYSSFSDFLFSPLNNIFKTIPLVLAFTILYFALYEFERKFKSNKLFIIHMVVIGFLMLILTLICANLFLYYYNPSQGLILIFSAFIHMSYFVNNKNKNSFKVNLTKEEVSELNNKKEKGDYKFILNFYWSKIKNEFYGHLLALSLIFVILYGIITPFFHRFPIIPVNIIVNSFVYQNKTYTTDKNLRLIGENSGYYFIFNNALETTLIIPKNECFNMKTFVQVPKKLGQNVNN